MRVKYTSQATEIKFNALRQHPEVEVVYDIKRLLNSSHEIFTWLLFHITSETISVINSEHYFYCIKYNILTLAKNELRIVNKFKMVINYYYEY
jgi:hypothetical protein